MCLEVLRNYVDEATLRGQSELEDPAQSQQSLMRYWSTHSLGQPMLCQLINHMLGRPSTSASGSSTTSEARVAMIDTQTLATGRSVIG